VIGVSKVTKPSQTSLEPYCW